MAFYFYFFVVSAKFFFFVFGKLYRDSIKEYRKDDCFFFLYILKDLCILFLAPSQLRLRPQRADLVAQMRRGTKEG